MLKPLLARGFLPRELPPLFSSKSFGSIAGLATLPSAFTDAKALWTQAVQHNLARPGGLRRRLAIPNPVSFYRLAKTFANNKGDLVAEWSKSPFSGTTPDTTCKGPRAIARDPSDRAAARASLRVGSRYLLRADISQFYPSIYSHSIAWVLHTKSAAKASLKDLTLLGNLIDRELQAGQFGQTKGIPIGPDTSLGIAELLLSPLDQRLKSECNIQGGIRFIDDIELGFRKLSDAEETLARLETLLNELELQLNATKTRIVELPDQVESVYVTTLRPHVPDASVAPASQWIDYFNRAFLASRSNRQDGVLRYAIAALQGVVVTPKAWGLVQNLLWQCIALDPGCVRFVVDVLLINKHKANLSPDTSVGTEAINSLIFSSATVGHGSEVVWSIWAALVLGLSITPSSQAAISLMDDANVAAASMIAKERKVLSPSFESPLWSSWFVKDCFDQEHWLFVYEALRRGWLPKEVAAAKLSIATCPKFLVAAGVTFLDVNAIDAYIPARLLSGSGSEVAGGGY